MLSLFKNNSYSAKERECRTYLQGGDIVPTSKSFDCGKSYLLANIASEQGAAAAEANTK